MNKKNLSLGCLIVFAIAGIGMIFFRKYTIGIWICGCIGIISIFLFAYFRASFQYGKSKETIQKNTIKQLATMRNQSGINELIFELYSRRTGADSISKYKANVDSINFMLSDLDNIEFDIQLSKLGKTLYIRYDEGFLKVDNSQCGMKQPIYVKEMSYDEIVSLLEDDLKDFEN